MQQDPSKEISIESKCGDFNNNFSIACSLTNAGCNAQVPVNINPL